MLISEFARATGLSRETARFYVRLGLLHPQTTQKGGRHPYLLFREEDVRAADVIRTGQALGLSLKEIADLMEQRRKGKLPREKRVTLMKTLLAKLDDKAVELDRLRTFVRAKIDWQKKGEKGYAPSFLLPKGKQAIGLVHRRIAPGSVTSALEPLRMARKLDSYRETARIALEPWLVEAALARLSRPLSPADQRIVVKATRTPHKVGCPKGGPKIHNPN